MKSNVNLTGSAENFIWIPLGILGLIVFVGIYFLGRSVGKSSEKGDERDQLGKDINKKNLSYPLSRYDQMADSLESAMNGAFTHEGQIYSVFTQINNIDDLNQLVLAFGERKGWWNLTSEQTLSQWLVNDLNQSELDKLNSILMKKNINFGF